MKINVLRLWLLLVIVYEIAYASENNNTTFDWDKIEDVQAQGTRLLSRRKRFIIFPEGSSFQLVFCTQTHGYLQVGDIVWFGSTAALAWELPTDPSIFEMFKGNKVFSNRRSDNKLIYYLDEDGKVIGKAPYHRKPIVNPAFAKRSVDVIKPTKDLSIKKMHDMQKNTNYLDSLHEKSIEFHRSGRRNLYAKVEKVLQALGWNGRECVLRMLCESRQEKNKQGTFLEEIIRATFTLPKGRGFEDLKLYDDAHGGSGHCASLYPACEDLHGMQLYK